MLALLALLLYVLWAVALSLVVVGWKLSQITRQEVQNFDTVQLLASSKADSYSRADKAYLNTLENLPLFGALVFIESQLPAMTAYFGIAALIIVAARVCQALAQLVSTSAAAVYLRFFMYIVQICAMAAMAVDILLGARSLL